MAWTKKDWEKKFPARRTADGGTVFYWQCAVGGGLDKHCVLPGFAWDKLSDYDFRKDGDKNYLSADRAVKDFLNATGGNVG